MIKKIWYIAYPTKGIPYLYLLVEADGVYKVRASTSLYTNTDLADAVRSLENSLGV